MLVDNKTEEEQRNITKYYKFASYIAKIFIAIFFLILIYTFYRSEIIYDGQISSYYKKYYLVSLVGILFWFGVLKLNEEIKLKVVMVTASIIVAIYLVEITLHFFIPHFNQFIQIDVVKVKENIAKKTNAKFDTRTKYQVYKELKDQGMDVAPATFPSYLISYYRSSQKLKTKSNLFPLSGISKKTTVYCNESGEYTVYDSDRYGFNNPDKEWDKSQIEWLLIGDSYVHGACVNPGEEISAQISIITGKNAINLGMGGSGPLIELGILTEYGKFIKPKKVLWFFFEKGDLQDLEVEKTLPILTNYLKPEFTQNLILRQPEVDGILDHYVSEILKVDKKIENEKETIERYKVFKKSNATMQKKNILWKTRIFRLRNLREYISFDKKSGNDFDFALLSKTLETAKNRIELWGGELYFIYVPFICNYQKRCPIHLSTNIKKKEVLATLKNLNIPIIDLHKELFLKHPDPLSLFPFRLVGHYNADGYKEVAKTIISKIE